MPSRSWFNLFKSYFLAGGSLSAVLAKLPAIQGQKIFWTSKMQHGEHFWFTDKSQLSSLSWAVQQNVQLRLTTQQVHRFWDWILFCYLAVTGTNTTPSISVAVRTAWADKAAGARWEPAPAQLCMDVPEKHTLWRAWKVHHWKSWVCTAPAAVMTDMYLIKYVGQQADILKY